MATERTTEETEARKIIDEIAAAHPEVRKEAEEVCHATDALLELFRGKDQKFVVQVFYALAADGRRSLPIRRAIKEAAKVL